MAIIGLLACNGCPTTCILTSCTVTQRTNVKRSSRLKFHRLPMYTYELSNILKHFRRGGTEHTTVQ